MILQLKMTLSVGLGLRGGGCCLCHEYKSALIAIIYKNYAYYVNANTPLVSHSSGQTKEKCHS